MARGDAEAAVDGYQHLDKFPRAPDALHMLKKIASVVKPIMRNRNWRVGTLTEFYPHENNLLGLNINRGQRICLRLRYATDRSQFLPLENVIDTMLHELSHNLIGPHNQEFHNLWNKLRDEYDDLKIKGFTGEGFLSEGHRVGGRQVPIHEARRMARAAAEQRKTLQKNCGQRLGGRPIEVGSDIRSVIADAAQRRSTITEGCASNTRQAEGLAEEASFNGFRTKAEEDDANQRAIDQALWELYQEEEMRKAGLEPNSSMFTSGGLKWDPKNGLALNTSDVPPVIPPANSNSPTAPPIPSKSPLRRPPPLNLERARPPSIRPPSVHDAQTGSKRGPSPPQLSRSAGPDAPHSFRDRPPPTLKPSVYSPKPANSEASPLGSPAPSSTGPSLQTLAPTTYTPPIKRKMSESPLLYDISSFDDDYSKVRVGSPTLRVASSSLASKTWTCPACTLNNRIEYLQCDACGEQQPDQYAATSALTTDTSLSEQIAEYEAIAVAREMGAKREAEMAQREAEAARQQRMLEMERSRLQTQAAERERLYGRAPPRPQTGPMGWVCPRCDAFMENQWWTCSACGMMKETS